LNFALRFAPTVAAEQQLREEFDALGIVPDEIFDPNNLSPEMRSAIESGMADAWAEFNTVKAEKFDTGQLGSADVFGTAEFLNGNYLYRMVAAVLGIYGNTAAEAMYPYLGSDTAGAPLGGANNYVVRFAPGQLPPVNAFWSLTMYGMPESLAQDRDGGYSFFVQHQSPGVGRETNWLPCPPGPFVMVLRLYWPKPEALDDAWQAPQPVKV